MKVVIIGDFTGSSKKRIGEQFLSDWEDCDRICRGDGRRTDRRGSHHPGTRHRGLTVLDIGNSVPHPRVHSPVFIPCQ